MKVPTDVIISISLKPGAVFLYSDDDFPDKKHFFVVLNKEISDNTSDLVLVCATSQVQARKQFIQSRNLGLETLVVVEDSDCDFLNKQSAFDCNSAMLRPIAYLKSKLDEDEVPTVQQVDTQLLSKLQNGVLKSRMVSEKIKKIIR